MKHTKITETRKIFTYRATKCNHQNLKKGKKHLQQLTETAKTETKMFDTEYSIKTLLKIINSSGIGTTNFGNKTINIVEPLFRYTNKDDYTFDDAEISNILKEVHIDKKILIATLMRPICKKN